MNMNIATAPVMTPIANAKKASAKVMPPPLRCNVKYLLNISPWLRFNRTRWVVDFRGFTNSGCALELAFSPRRFYRPESIVSHIIFPSIYAAGHFGCLIRS